MEILNGTFVRHLYKLAGSLGFPFWLCFKIFEQEKSRNQADLKTQGWLRSEKSLCEHQTCKYQSKSF